MATIFPVVTDVSAHPSGDKAFTGIKKMSKEDPEHAAAVADELIKNTYRTLMTRGMKGCYVYCCDPALREHLRWSASAAVEYDSEG